LIVLVAYDIEDDETRVRLSDYLKSKGLTRIQRSVFVGRLLPSTAKDVERALPRFVKGERDVIHYIPLLEYSLRYLKCFGHPLAVLSVDREPLVV
jgi:CRISPR-associated protein Cas2